VFQGRALLKSAIAGTLSTTLVISKSVRDRFIALSSDSALVRNKMATLNEHISVLAAILSDISDGSDTNFSYMLLASECQQRNNGNEGQFKTNKHQTKSQFV